MEKLTASELQDLLNTVDQMVNIRLNGYRDLLLANFQRDVNDLLQKYYTFEVSTQRQGDINIAKNSMEAYGIICYADEELVRFDKYLLTKATFDKLSKAELVCKILSMQNE